MSQKFLSWDCAHRTLAWSYVTIDLHIFATIRMLLQKLRVLIAGLDNDDFKLMMEDTDFIDDYLFIICAINYFLGRFIQYHSHGVIDITEDLLKNVDEITRAKKLYRFLQRLEITPDTKVLIEYQPPRIGDKTNNKSTVVSSMLVMYYINYNPELVSPKLKTRVTFRDDLSYEKFLAMEPATKDKAKARYSAQKKHSRANFEYFLEVFGLNDITEGISKQVWDDLADSTIQILAYIVDRRLFC